VAGSSVAEVGVARQDSAAPRTRRTRQHVIAAMGLIHVLKAFIDKGHTADQPREDYGYDLIAVTFDEKGYLEDGDIRIQIKATDQLHKMRRGNLILCRIKIEHYGLWIKARMPVFLIQYDAQEKKAYWLYVQAYFTEDPARRPKGSVKTLTVRIPLANQFTEGTVDYMRARKAARLAQLGQSDHHG
jgi:hypothetical protein